MFNMFKHTIIFLLAVQLLLAPVAATELYMWTDEKGIKHYSNTGPDDQAESFSEQNDIALEPDKDVQAIETPEPEPPSSTPQTTEESKTEEINDKAVGTFESGLFIRRKNTAYTSKIIFTLSDGSVWEAERATSWKTTATWHTGTKVFLNRTDGIIYRNPDSQVKVSPAE